MEPPAFLLPSWILNFIWPSKSFMTATLGRLLQQPFWLLGQGDAGQPAAEGQSTGAPGQSLIFQILSDPFALIILSGMLFILLVLRPQQKQMKQHQQSLANLKKNDRVITSGGVHGTIVQANSGDATVVLRIDENSGARMTINRDAIASIVKEEEKQ